MYVFYHILEISTIVSSNILLSPYSFNSLSETPMMQVLNLLLLSYRFLRLCSCFLSLCFLCCSAWMDSTILSSSSLILSFVISIILLSLPAIFFCQYIFNFYSFYFFFPNDSYFYFSFVSREFIIDYLKHFYDGCFKFLSFNLNVRFIPVLASIDCLFSFKLLFSCFLVWWVIFDFIVDVYLSH